MRHESEKIVGNAFRRGFESRAECRVDALERLIAGAMLPDRCSHPIERVVAARAQVQQDGFTI
jgi:hypothetical protein